MGLSTFLYAFYYFISELSCWQLEAKCLVNDIKCINFSGTEIKNNHLSLLFNYLIVIKKDAYLIAKTFLKAFCVPYIINSNIF